jgi:hypothetical protein
MSGSMPALRIFLDLCQVASEKVALREASQSSDPRKHGDVSTLTDEELEKIINAGRKDQEKENAD